MTFGSAPVKNAYWKLISPSGQGTDEELAAFLQGFSPCKYEDRCQAASMMRQAEDAIIRALMLSTAYNFKERNMILEMQITSYGDGRTIADSCTAGLHLTQHKLNEAIRVLQMQTVRMESHLSRIEVLERDQDRLKTALPKALRNDFYWAIERCLEGNKVRRGVWKPELYMAMSDEDKLALAVDNESGSNSYCLGNRLHENDLRATDWEIVHD